MHIPTAQVSRTNTYIFGGIRYTLLPVKGGVINDAQGEYMRLLPPADAIAWLTQQHHTASRRPELPAVD
ncbi:hypothetical protein [Streptomyces sp. A1136]|uniref:hypothetical protein n=1 Tax=Streptomyces sp. A1136 TaxID=2563102 RepID=UPI00109EBB8F|nr:hypothetical protein [Streptomyces sp. A1136]THA53205.1 hypothetical protein E6R62_19110 [Streptomyces sp. A1136]